MRAIKLAAVLMMAGGLGVAAGCQEEQFEAAEENYIEERQELSQEIDQATRDQTITEDEAEDVAEQRQETREAAGEVAEQAGDLIESRSDE